MKKLLLGTLLILTMGMTACGTSEVPATKEINDSEHAITGQQENKTEDKKESNETKDKEVISQDKKEEPVKPTAENQSQSYDPAVDGPIDGDKTALKNELTTLYTEMEDLYKLIEDQTNMVNKYGLNSMHYQSYTTQAANNIRNFKLVKPTDHDCILVYECLVNAKDCAGQSFSNMYLWEKNPFPDMESPQDLYIKAMNNIKSATDLFTNIVNLRVKQ